MPSGSADITLTAQEAMDGLTIMGSFAGGGLPPSVAVIIAVASGILPVDSEGASITIFSVNPAIGASGGSVSTLVTMNNSGNGKYYFTTGGDVVLPDTFWSSGLAIQVGAVNFVDVIVDVNLTWINSGLLDFIGPDLVDSPEDVVHSDGPNWDDDTEKGDNTFTFSYPNTNAENPTGFAAVRTKDGISEITASYPWTNGITDYELKDYIFEPGTYTYQIVAYKTGVMSLSPGSEFTVDAGGGVVPDISIIGGLGIDLALESTEIFIADPSGIYTVDETGTHDTLYERLTGITSVDVPIPTPFGTTGYLP